MHSRVLIVEDDPLQAEVLERGLQRAGFYAETAGDGVAAIARVRTGFFEAVVVDYRIPVIDGVAVARVIRESAQLGAAPVLIALTASPGSVRLREREGQALFDAVLEKPVTLAALTEVLERILSGRRRDGTGTGLDAPWRAVNTLARRVAGSAMRAGGAVKVLVVDDDDVIRGVVAQAMARSGYEVETAADGFLGLQRAESGGFDIVVMDYQMPDMNGLAAAELIFRLFTRADRPRFVAFTAVPDLLVATDGNWTRIFDEVVSKASGVEALAETVTSCVAYKARPSGHDSIAISPATLLRVGSALAGRA